MKIPAGAVLMTVLTRLTKKDFLALLKHYNIGDYLFHKHVEYALGNTNYILRTTKGRFVVKVFEQDDEESVRYQLNIEEFLNKEGVKVPKVIFTKKGKDILMVKNKPVTVYKFVPGTHPKKFPEELVKDLAENMGFMHKKLLRLKLRGREDFPKADEAIDFSLKKYKFRPTKYLVEQCKKTNKELKDIDYKKLKKSIIHSDLSDMNFLVERNKLKVFLDWGDAHKDFLVHDIAILLKDIFIRPNKVKKDKISLFMKHYQKRIKLNLEEKKALLVFMKVALLCEILWEEWQKQKHPDLADEIDRHMKMAIGKYKQMAVFLKKTFKRGRDPSFI